MVAGTAGFVAFDLVVCLSFDLAMATIDCGLFRTSSNHKQKVSVEHCRNRSVEPITMWQKTDRPRWRSSNRSFAEESAGCKWPAAVSNCRAALCHTLRLRVLHGSIDLFPDLVLPSTAVTALHLPIPSQLVPSTPASLEWPQRFRPFAALSVFHAPQRFSSVADLRYRG